jgi:hypothetical protein
MKLSARNVLSATVKAVTPGAVDTRDPEGEIGRTGTRVSLFLRLGVFCLRFALLQRY